MMELWKKLVGDKKEYKEMKARAKALPADYQFVFDKIQKFMWNFAAGNGYDMQKIHYELIELFEEGSAEGKHVLDITGEDVAAFCEELMRNARTYTGDWHEALNRDILDKFGKRDASK